MKLASGQFAKQANRQLAALQSMLQELAQSAAARDVRKAAINPFLREQGEFLAGSGQQLSDLLAGYIPGLAPKLQASPITDTAVGLGLGGAGGYALSQFLNPDPEYYQARY